MHLLALSGDAAQSGGGIVAAGTASGAGVLVQAPAGVNDFGSFMIGSGLSVTPIGAVTLACPVCVVPVPGSVASPVVSSLAVVTVPTTPVAGRVDATLIGHTVSLDKPVLANVLALYSQADTTQTASASIDAIALTGAAGVPAGSGGGVQIDNGLVALGWNAGALGWTSPSIGNVALATTAANHVVTLGQDLATGNFSFAATQASLAVAGPVAAGYGGTPGSVGINATGNLAVSGPVVSGSAVSYTHLTLPTILRV